MGLITAKVSERNTRNKTAFLVELKSTKFDKFYYIMPDSKIIASWEFHSEPENSIWEIDFIDNDLVVFYQGDYIMCSTEEKYDDHRRKVTAFKNGIYNFTSPECQWLLGQCDRRTNVI